MPASFLRYLPHADLMSHSHDHRRQASTTALGLALGCTLLIAAAQFLGGIWANSLALQGDAGHMVSDAAALGVAIGAAWLAARPLTARRTFGFQRAEVLAALLNAAFLLGVSAWVALRAVPRLGQEVEIAAGPVLGIAVLGLVVNLVALRILGGHQGGNLNIRGAFLHVLGDTLGSAGVIVSAIVIHTTGWTPVDALASLAIAALLVVSAIRLLRDSLSVLMLVTPSHVDSEAVKRRLEAVPGVRGIHDLHIWTVNSDFVSLSCHAEVDKASSPDAILRAATTLLREDFGIRHVTIQPESSRVHAPADSCQIVPT